MASTIDIFCCYAREDQALLGQLLKHLMPLQRQGLITLWSDTDIDAGAEWEQAIHTHLDTAHIILLLISPDFMASEYCYSQEMQRAVQRHEQHEARVLPILLRPTRWQKTPFAKLQMLPPNAKPVTDKSWHTLDDAFYAVEEGVNEVVKDVHLRGVLHMSQSNEPSEHRELPLKADVLLVTVTKVEGRSVLDLFEEEVGRKFERKHIGVKTYFDLGIVGRAHIVMVQSEMGETGPSGALLTVDEGIRILSPSAVIMVGIAFGVDEKQQKPGNILISQQLLGYELQKVSTDPQGHMEIIARGDRPQASARMLSRFRSGVLDWQGPDVEFGLVLSGAKLIDNQDFRDQLRKLAPEAIGGEMEGTGLYSAAELRKVDWILVKAICDWADGNKRVNKEAGQKQAAESAVRFTLHVLKQGGFAQDGIESTRAGSKAPHPPKREIGTTLRTYNGHTSWVVAVTWGPDGSRIASSGGDGTVQVWEADTGHTLLAYRGHPWRFARVNWPPTIYAVAWSPEGLRLASAGDGTNVFVWNATTGQTLALYQGHAGMLPNVSDVAWSPNGKCIASACSCAGLDKTIHIWDAATGELIRRLDASYGLFYPNFSVSTLAWSPDGSHIAAACGDKTIRIWNATTGQRISTIQTRSAGVSHLIWSPDSTKIATAHSERIAQIWDSVTGKSIVKYLGHADGVRYIAWSPDGARIATASNDKTVQLWEVDTGNHIHTYRGHDHWATSVAWSPDGTRLASGSNDRTVQIWQAN